ncbi:MAG TPA: bifunctional riboflavin kinase/FAD synthetase, partial [Rhizomicrobium sp.]|nr:bifunctional riboflavin kinase/FAD synthetase [Rhizomicrobium sp.]
MRIFRHFQDVPPPLRGSVVAVGNFDGVHLGHRALIGEAARQAHIAGKPLTVLAFEPHPQEYFRSLRQEAVQDAAAESFRLTPLRSKARLIAELGADAFFALPFDAAMAGRLAPEFIRDVLVDGLGVSGVVVGEDFVFGKGRGGNLQTLRDEGTKNGFTVTAFNTILAGAGEKISSTRIREALKAARPGEAAKLLGRHWAVEARVEHGDGRGRTMGFPTANMHLGHCLAPAFGIYAVRATIFENDQVPHGEISARRDGVASFGIRPMYQVTVPLMETHLFNFDGDLYGKHLSVELVDYVRPEAKFSGLPALIAQIAEDCQSARAILARTPRL